MKHSGMRDKGKLNNCNNVTIGYCLLPQLQQPHFVHCVRPQAGKSLSFNRFWFVISKSLCVLTEVEMSFQFEVSKKNSYIWIVTFSSNYWQRHFKCLPFHLLSSGRSKSFFFIFQFFWFVCATNRFSYLFLHQFSLMPSLCMQQKKIKYKMKHVIDENTMKFQDKSCWIARYDDQWNGRIEIICMR